MNDAALFELTRLQILGMEAQRSCFSAAYVHAWNHRIYPVVLDQARDRAFGDSSVWYLGKAQMVILERWLSSLPGFSKSLTSEEFAGAAHGDLPTGAKDVREAVVELSGKLGGLWAIVEGCRYFRHLGYGTPATWELLAKAHPDLAGVTRDVTGLAEVRY